MTPPAAATAAGRKAAAAPRRVSGPAARGAKRTGARTSASTRVASPRVPRRISGPIGGRVAAAAAAVALPQVAPRPQAPRRRPVAVPRPVRRPDLPAGARALERLRALPDHRLLDRLIGGRTWIVLIGTLLAGIVTLQLTLLKLNAGIGRAVGESAALTQRNAALEDEISKLSDPQRVIADATRAGFVFAPPASARYLTATPADAGRALSVMRVPQAAAAIDTATPVADTTAPAMGADPASTDTTGTPTSADATAAAPPAVADTSEAVPVGGAAAPTGAGQ